MLTAHRVQDLRAAEKTLLEAEWPPDGPPSGTVSALMAKAAAGLATAVINHLKARRGGVTGSRVGILVGSGDNGGDALVAGARLAGRGATVLAVLVSDRAHAEGLERLQRAGGRVVTWEAAGSPGVMESLLGCDVILDGVLGIGASGGLREPVASLVSDLRDALAGNYSDPTIMAVDLPSGIGPDDGSVPGPVLPAEVTVTFGAIKPGLMLPPAEQLVGRIELVDIGLDLEPAPAVWRLEGTDVAELWPAPGPASHKYIRGVLGVIAGSPNFTGAALLATSAAATAGVGMIRFTGSDGARSLIRDQVPEAVHTEGRVQAWVVGSGVDPDDASLTPLIADALASGLPCVVDAGALSVVPDLLELEGERRWLLTPHAGEAADLLSEIDSDTSRTAVEADPGEAVRRLARLTGAAVLLKGSTTLVAAPDGTLFSQADGTPWLATAGSGDVLAGIAGALVSGLAGRANSQGGAQDVPALAVAGAAAAFVHGHAGRRAAGQPTADQPAADQASADQPAPGGDPSGHPLRARDIIASLPKVLTRSQ